MHIMTDVKIGKTNNCDGEVKHHLMQLVCRALKTFKRHFEDSVMVFSLYCLQQLITSKLLKDLNIFIFCRCSTVDWFL